jgi:hypothetical protein
VEAAQQELEKIESAGCGRNKWWLWKEKVRVVVLVSVSVLLT